jgi:hypothetical protein
MVGFLVTGLLLSSQPLVVQDLVNSRSYQIEILQKLVRKEYVPLNQKHMETLFDSFSNDLVLRERHLLLLINAMSTAVGDTKRQIREVYLLESQQFQIDSNIASEAKANYEALYPERIHPFIRKLRGIDAKGFWEK